LFNYTIVAAPQQNLRDFQFDSITKRDSNPILYAKLSSLLTMRKRIPSVEQLIVFDILLALKQNLVSKLQLSPIIRL